MKKKSVEIESNQSLREFFFECEYLNKFDEILKEIFLNKIGNLNEQDVKIIFDQYLPNSDLFNKLFQESEILEKIIKHFKDLIDKLLSIKLQYSLYNKEKLEKIKSISDNFEKENKLHYEKLKEMIKVKIFTDNMRVYKDDGSHVIIKKCSASEFQKMSEFTEQGMKLKNIIPSISNKNKIEEIDIALPNKLKKDFSSFINYFNEKYNSFIKNKENFSHYDSKISLLISLLIGKNNINNLLTPFFELKNSVKEYREITNQETAYQKQDKSHTVFKIKFLLLKLRNLEKSIIFSPEISDLFQNITYAKNISNNIVNITEQYFEYCKKNSNNTYLDFIKKNNYEATLNDIKERQLDLEKSKILPSHIKKFKYKKLNTSARKEAEKENKLLSVMNEVETDLIKFFEEDIEIKKLFDYLLYSEIIKNYQDKIENLIKNIDSKMNYYGSTIRTIFELMSQQNIKSEPEVENYINSLLDDSTPLLDYIYLKLKKHHSGTEEIDTTYDSEAEENFLGIEKIDTKYDSKVNKYLLGTEKINTTYDSNDSD